MTIATGSRLGPYEVLSPLGAGGMGEVYRGRDTRLGREVAIKVLPSSVSDNPESLRRFEQEARAASALNHPNIVTVYEVGRADATSYIAMELVEGKTVRELAAPGPLSMKRALAIAAQAADGLAKAHAAGIVHRDLKPENLMVSSDGFVKILDFGLAKLVEPKTEHASEALTMAGARTESGIVVGTVGYMSPEQASGAPLDFRSDQFALGVILYEMVTGRRAFARATAVDTLSAILHDEPEPVASLRAETPLPLRWLIDRCLAKEPGERYASTRDLARDLAVLRDHLGETGATGVMTARPARLRVSSLLAAIAAGALLIVGGLVLGRRLETRPQPSYRQLTFRQGTIRAARFSPDGNTVVYGASWAGQPLEVFTLRPGTPESRSLGLSGGNVLGVSSSGELAVLLRHKYLGLFPGAGTLARLPLEGGTAPREVLEDIDWADWAPGGASMAIVRWAGTRQRLEFPVGKVLYETSGWISHPRISPDGLGVAFLDHPISGDDRGTVMVVDRAGKRAVSGSWATVWGLAWPPGGKEIWFTAARVGSSRELHAISLSGKERLVTRVMGTLTLHDISRDGRVLLAQDNLHFGTLALPPGAREEKELSWLDLGMVTDISADGRKVLIFEVGEGGGEGYSVYMRATDGSPPVRLGPGMAPAFSPDGKWVVTTDIRTDPAQLALLPTGAGEPVPLTRDRIHHDFGAFFPDGKRVLFMGREPGRGNRLYVQAISGGTPQPVTSEGPFTGGPISPDGRFVAALGPGGKVVLYPTAPGEPLNVPDATAMEFPIQWTPDGKFLYVFRFGELPARVSRLDPFTGRKELWKEFAPSDPAGAVEVRSIAMTPDARSYAYTYVRILSTLFVAEGLR
jgi:Tol biopolymer transport system component